LAGRRCACPCPAAGRGLDHDGVADLVGDPHRFPRVGDLAEVAGHGRDLGLGGRLLALDLVAHGGDGARVGSDEDDARFLERDGEGLALGQEAVARVHGLRAGLTAGIDDLVDQQIRLRGRRRADGDGLLGHLHVQAVPVGVGVDGDGLDAELARALDDAAGDLAAVGDQDLLEHMAVTSRARKECLRPCRIAMIGQKQPVGRESSTPRIACRSTGLLPARGAVQPCGRKTCAVGRSDCASG
jgi:hypothetical protein